MTASAVHQLLLPLTSQCTALDLLFDLVVSPPDAMAIPVDAWYNASHESLRAMPCSTGVEESALRSFLLQECSMSWMRETAMCRWRTR